MGLSIWLQPLVSFLFAVSTLASGPTSIFINKVPEYSLLATCAETEISTIVRDMSYGCGDDSKTTSYACFCYQSSAIFSSIISKHVSSECTNNTDQVTSALEVFSSYCELGAVQLQTTSSSGSPSSATSNPSQGSSATAAPASTPATITVTATPSSTPQSSNNSHTAAIAAGVSIPLALIALGLAGFFLWRRRQHNKSQEPIELASDVEQRHETPAAPIVRELKAESKPPLAELDSGERPPELDTPTRMKFGHEMPHELDTPAPREKSGLSTGE